MDYDEFKSWLEILLCNSPVKGDYPTAGKYKFPQLAQVNYLPEEPVYPFNYLKSTLTKGHYWYHCFTAERNFHRLYNCFQDYVELLRQAKGIISADFSLFRDYPEEVLIAKCRANRLVDYALQQAGIPMIPTAGFAGESSWEWCFDGLPKNSTVAVTTNCLGFANRIDEAFDQIADELARYPDDEPKPPGKVVFLSRHESFEIGFRAFCEGYKEAKRKGFIRGEVEFWFHGEIHTFEEEEE